MSPDTTLQALVERYLDERHRLGFSARTQAYALRSFARHVQAVGHIGPITVDVMADWARRDSHTSSDPHTWARRLKTLRSFMRWLAQFEPVTEVPDDAVFGRLPERLAPHIYSEQEIIDLLAAARKLGPASDIRGIVYETLFGLIASTGMRISEALALTNADVDLKQGMLTIHLIKFGKSRQVPLHPSTVEALRHYRGKRDMAGISVQDEAPFFVGTRGRRRGTPLSDRQVHRVFIELRERLVWRNRGAHHAPRIHDLRHTFVVRRIVLWQAQGVDIDQAMLSLSTYVGHAMVTNTYWYLSAVPELMALAAGRFETFMSLAEVRHA
ncbi:MAG: tyrosine-type recombinase/integrase [Rhodocyclaceae bacterium]|nr:tyrosine-type recombinase/integrase [Rhodocyclaceae bacterium]